MATPRPPSRRVPQTSSPSRVHHVEMSAPLRIAWPGRAASLAAAFETFFEQSYQRVVGLVALVTGDPALAEDAVQDAYARAYSRWGRVGRLDRPDLWVFRVASRIAIDRWRKERHEAALHADLEAATGNDIERLWIQWGLTGLSPMQRTTFILRHIQGLSVKQVAEAVDASPETVKTHLERARRRLRALLRQEDRE